jgi:hypothetical protein
VTDDDECIHGLGPVACCTICNGRAKREADQPSWRHFPAKYPGQCPGCDLPIAVGQAIAWADGMSVHHEGCAS